MASDDGSATSLSEEARLERSTGSGDITAGVLCVLMALAGVFIVVPIWVYVPQKVAGTVDSPAVMPLVMFGLIGLLGALLLIETWRAGAARQSHRSIHDWSRAAGMIAICAGYLILILVIGLPVATGLSLAAAMFYFGEHRWGVIVPVAIITPLLLWSFFAYVAQVPMPRPLLELGSHAPDNQLAAGSKTHARLVRS